MYIAVDSHDTERILTRMGNNLDKTKLAYLFQFAYPGAPAIYYGDEIGISGGKDPGCRGAFPWDEHNWNTELRNLIKTLVNLRKRHMALRRGDYTRVKDTDNQTCYAFTRRSGDDQVMIVMNASSKEATIRINCTQMGWLDGRILTNLLFPANQYPIFDHFVEVTLPAWGGVWLT
jgi:glycosidase